MLTTTNILLVALVGVIVADNPVISTNEALDVENTFVFVVLTTCNTEPAGKPAVEALLSNVPLLSGKVSVLSLLLSGAAIVNVAEPDTSGARVILLMLAPYEPLLRLLPPLGVVLQS